MAKAPGHRYAEHFLARSPRLRGADAVGAVGVGADLNRPCRIAGEAKRDLGEGRLVELLHHAHTHRVELRLRLPSEDLGGDVSRRRVALKECEEGLLYGEVPGVAHGEDVRMVDQPSRRQLGGEKAAIVSGKSGE